MRRNAPAPPRSRRHDVRLAAGATVVVAYTVGFAVAGAGRLLLKRS